MTQPADMAPLIMTSSTHTNHDTLAGPSVTTHARTLELEPRRELLQTQAAEVVKQRHVVRQLRLVRRVDEQHVGHGNRLGSTRPGVNTQTTIDGPVSSPTNSMHLRGYCAHASRGTWIRMVGYASDEQTGLRKRKRKSNTLQPQEHRAGGWALLSLPYRYASRWPCSVAMLI